MNILLLSVTFTIYLYFLHPNIFAPTVKDSVNLLLPGFQGHVLQAGLIEEVRITSGSFYRKLIDPRMLSQKRISFPALQVWTRPPVAYWGMDSPR